MKRAYLELHIAVVLFGITAILGRLITLDAVTLVWWRVLITAISMLAFASVRRAFKTIPRKRILQYTATGFLIGAHWVTFFLAIKLANISIALVAFATQSFFTAIFEPIIVGTRFRKYELALGVLIVPAMWLIVQEVDTSMQLGMWIGVISAMILAIFTSITKRMVTLAEPIQISFFQMSGACLLITVFLPFIDILGYTWQLPQGADLAYIVILALLCTTLAYVLAMRALRHLTAFTSNLTTNLEPIYGILLAALIFNEHEVLSGRFYIGAATIIGVVLIYPLMRRRFDKKLA